MHSKALVGFVLCSCISGLLISWYPMPHSDLAFGFAYTGYIWSANALCFNSNRLALARKRPVLSLGQGEYEGKPAFVKYMVCFQIATVLAPLLTICLAPAEVAAPAVSPLVLLLVQVANEGSTHEFHDTIRILVPIGFDALDSSRFSHGLLMQLPRHRLLPLGIPLELFWRLLTWLCGCTICSSSFFYGLCQCTLTRSIPLLLRWHTQ